MDVLRTWTKTFGGVGVDWGNSVQQTQDGGYIVTGVIDYTGARQGDVWLVKTNDNGDTVWTKTFGGTAEDEGYTVRQTQDGAYIVMGNTVSYGAGGRDLWLIRTDANGDTVWTRTYGGAGDDFMGSVGQTQDEGYIVTGSTRSFGAGLYDAWLVKTDADGDTVWTRTYGGTSYDYGYAVQQTQDGGYIVAGGTRSYGAGGEDVWLVKTDASGDTLWTRTFGGTSDEASLAVQQTHDGGYIITGYTESYGAGGTDVWLIKTDAGGNMTWSKTFGGTSPDWGSSVQQTVDGGYILTGRTSSYGAGDDDVWLIKTDANGDTTWTSTLGGTGLDIGYSVQQTADGGYVIAGETESYGAGGDDVWLIKTDGEGRVDEGGGK